jgi:5'-AMP-activated protein kinase regulatory beta subunit
VEFSLHAPEATRVVVAGDFNGWQADDHPLKRNKQGLWKTNLHLPPGTYQYRFLVDEVWCEDPGCLTRMDNPFGSQNCVMVVE